MPAVYLLEDVPVRQLDNNGNPVSGTLLHTWVAGTTTPLATYVDSTGTTPLPNPVVSDSQGFFPQVWLTSAAYKLEARKPDDVTVFWQRDNILASASASDLSNLLNEFADSTNSALGDALVAVHRLLLAGAFATTMHKVNEYLPVNAVTDYQVPNDGVTNATPAIQAMSDALATAGVAAEIFFPPGTYLLQSPASETGEPRSYAASVIWRGLKNCRITGGKGTLFTQNSGGAGAPQFAMFRYELCENVETYGFAADGSGIDIHTLGAARSSFAFYCNHNLDTKVDLAYPNRGLHFHHLRLDHFGGGICAATRTEAGFAYPLVTQGLSIHDINGTDFTGQNHFVASTYTENVHLFNCNIKNPVTAATAQIGNYFADMSAGTVNALVENCYATGFTGGVKAETHTGAGIASNEDRISQNVLFSNLTLEQMGDPITIIFPGAGGGGFAGIKLNGINHKAIGNTITARSSNITTGGLYAGIILTSTAVSPVETKLLALDNDIKGPVIGINHDSPTDPNHRFACDILNNKVRDPIIPATPIAGNDGTGIIASRNCLVQGNDIYRTKRSAILLQSADQTFARGNFAYDCADTNNASIAAPVVYSQSGSGAQGYFEFDQNAISDSRGAGAAAYGYFFEGGTTYTNRYVFNPGSTAGLLTAIAFDTYFSAFGTSWVVGGVKTVPRVIYVTQSPQTGGAASLATWNKGDVAINLTPAVGSPDRWICTVAGSPGTWRPTANLT